MEPEHGEGQQAAAIAVYSNTATCFLRQGDLITASTATALSATRNILEYIPDIRADPLPI